MAKQRAAEMLLRMRDDQPPQIPFPPVDGLLPPENREKVVDFIAEVCEEFSLQTQTTGLAVHYFDRCMSAPPDTGFPVELVGLVCILIASKFVETKVPAVKELCLISQNEYSRQDVKDAEITLLERLKWELHAATPHSFLEQLVVIFEVQDSPRKRAEFFVDMSYYEYNVLEFAPMTVAAAALLLSWKQLGHCERALACCSELTCLCDVAKNTLIRCEETLQEHFNSTFNAPAHMVKGRGGALSPQEIYATFEEPCSIAHTDSSCSDDVEESTTAAPSYPPGGPSSRVYFSPVEAAL